MRSRGGDPERRGKRHPLDFLLWRGISDPDDPAAWDSPLGRGRPGWHIECSVMSDKLLSAPFDLHGGGNDLIFPHHECEIAQSRGLGQKKLAKHWVHVAPLAFDGEKMSKSLGNLVFAKDLLTRYEPAVIRLALMKYSYRVGGEWQPELLDKTAHLLGHLRIRMTTIGEAAARTTLGRVRAAIDDDLNMPEIVRALSDCILQKAGTAKKGDARPLIQQGLGLLGLK
jgi:L-cysteine:1D-myo-inositol 2-amino-2-deoxy-alpha-D-glucopyranoside ligase